MSWGPPGAGGPPSGSVRVGQGQVLAAGGGWRGRGQGGEGVVKTAGLKTF